MPTTAAKASNPKIETIKSRLINSVDLALEKAVAHLDDPKKYPMPKDAKSLERRFKTLLEAIPARRRKNAVDEVSKRLKGAKNNRGSFYGHFSAVDLKSSVSVVDQIKKLPVPKELVLTKTEQSDLKAKAKELFAGSPKRAKAPAATAEAVELNLLIQDLTCVKKTEVGKDEMNLALVLIDDLGNSIQGPSAFVGKFKKGDTLPVTNPLLKVSLTNGVFPKTFLGGCLLVEKDLVRDKAFFDAISAAFIGACITMITVAGVLIIGGAATAPIVLGLTAAAVLAGLTSSFFRAISDDIAFAVDTLALDAPVLSQTTFDRTVTAEIGDYGGSYKASIQWLAK